MNILDIIARKRDGKELSSQEIAFFIGMVAAGTVPDYQTAAWLMAAYLQGMSGRETLDLTLAMRDSGERIDLTDLPGPAAVDKHSTGGVGDKTSLIVVPILAAAGVPVLKMSGRGLGYSGGTIDKLESIPGFRTQLGVDEAKRIVRTSGAVIIAQSATLAPADGAMYALRDVTATVESMPLIASSIMCKKLAAGARRIIVDVKCGRGAFMKSMAAARSLAARLVDIGAGAGVPTAAVISSMDEPLGSAVGNALEVREAFEILGAPSAAQCAGRSEACRAYRELCIELASRGIAASGKCSQISGARQAARELLASGAALSKLAAMVAAQGGPATPGEILGSLPAAALTHELRSTCAGTVVQIDAEAVGRLAVELGAGRAKKGEPIDHAVGIVLHKKCGERAAAGDLLATLHLRSADAQREDELARKLYDAYRIEPVEEYHGAQSLILDVVE